MCLWGCGLDVICPSFLAPDSFGWHETAYTIPARSAGLFVLLETVIIRVAIVLHRSTLTTIVFYLLLDSFRNRSPVVHIDRWIDRRSGKSTSHQISLILVRRCLFFTLFFCLGILADRLLMILFYAFSVFTWLLRLFLCLAFCLSQWQLFFYR